MTPMFSLSILQELKNAKKLIDRVEHDKWKGYVNGIVVSEVVYRYLRLALNVPRYKLRKYVVKYMSRVTLINWKHPAYKKG